MTTTQTEIQIHEFSTGIRPEKTADGGWVSLGFTGQYMNATIDPIPHAVLRSIANKEFAVAEGASSDEPAIIGRVVPGGEESDWSVITIVTRGRDEKGRSASFYRYFLCEGDKGTSNLWRILCWIEDYQLRIGEMPVFQPFDFKEVGQFNSCTVSTPPQINILAETEIELLTPTSPILIPLNAQYTLQEVNRLANKKAIADGNKQPVAWAYKVEALEQPGRFQIIQAASDKAYELLEKAKASISQMTVPLVDEQAIKSAIKGLMNSSKVKPEHVQAIAEPLGNTEIPESYWKEIFDGQGAANALKQGIYSPQMVRLLTLRAIVIPGTLPEYVNWLEKGDQQSDNHSESAAFQFQIKNSLNQIPETVENIQLKIIEGIRFLLPKLLENKVTVDNVYQLLKTKNGLWANLYRQVSQTIEDDLQLMIQVKKGSKDIDFKLTDNTWQSILAELKRYWQTPFSNTCKKYEPFAKIFTLLASYNLAAIFYHISFGQVPKDIFEQAFHTSATETQIYGLRVKRKLTPKEEVILTVRENKNLITFVLVIISVIGVIGVALYTNPTFVTSIIKSILPNINEKIEARGSSTLTSSDNVVEVGQICESLFSNENIKLAINSSNTLMINKLSALSFDPTYYKSIERNEFSLNRTSQVNIEKIRKIRNKVDC